MVKQADDNDGLGASVASTQTLAYESCLRQPLTLSSALTESQPSQSHCSAEAVTGRAVVSTETGSQVVRQRSAEPPAARDLALIGDLSERIGEWCPG